MKDRKVPYEVIVAAKHGDSGAMNTILLHYNRQIEANSRRPMFDEYGNPHSVIDPEIEDRIRAKIIDRVINDFDPYSLPAGETLEE